MVTKWRDLRLRNILIKRLTNRLKVKLEDKKLRLTGVSMAKAIFCIIQSIHEGRRFTFIYEKICLAKIKS